MTHREKILELLGRKNLPINRLAQAACDNDICTRDMVYRWLRDDSDIGVSKAESLLALCKSLKAKMSSEMSSERPA